MMLCGPRLAFGAVLLTIAPCAAFAADSVPTSGVSFVQLDQRNSDIWANNIKAATASAKSICWVLQGDFNYYRPCVPGSLPAQALFMRLSKPTKLDQNLIKAAARNHDEAQQLRYRLSLFDRPIPLAPAFVMPPAVPRPGNPRSSSDTTKKVVPLEESIAITRSAAFDQSLTNLVFAISYYWAMTTSFENVQIGNAIEVAWDYWARAADQGNTVCIKSLQDEARQMEGFGFDAGSGCFRAVRVLASKPKTDPANFANGVALCMVDPGQQNSFLYHCLLMTMTTTADKKYVRSIIAPTMGMGGGSNLVDDFGNFGLVCNFVKGQIRDRLTQIKTDFQMSGVYQIQSGFRINAYSRFQRFNTVNRYGLFKMQTSQPDSKADALAMSFYGKWWRENRNDPNIPLFTDDDVYMFKDIFEAEVGGKGACSIVPKQDVANAE